MNWHNVRLIYAREIRDQLRDRRTLFMIAVLPLMLYPLLGMSVFQLSQFLRTSEPRVLVVGGEQLVDQTDLPPLFEGGRFASGIFDDPADASRFAIEFVEADASDTAAGDAALESARQRLQRGEVQVVLYFPPNFVDRQRELHAESQAVVGGRAGRGRPSPDELPPITDEIPMFYNAAQDKSRMAYRGVEQVIDTWRAQVVRANLLSSRMPASITRPFQLKPQDVAERRQQQAALWSKVLPFVLFIWALTGAFYPAVDLCAGEKERGTLETLLSSPALRSEIVWGKLFTVMTFSGATALLNLVSLGITAQYVVTQFKALPTAGIAARFDLPPPAALLWLLVALLPMTALFSALCLACAAFARSTKEGQYYLMPLLLVIFPLMMLPMAPGAELDLGSSLIPVTGVVLLLKGLIEGNYAGVLPYVLPVGAVTLICCLLAIRWAVYQFNQESVLFRESERLDLRRWVVHLVRDRQPTPTLAGAFFCVALIYVVQFFTRLAITADAPASPDFRYLALLVFISQVVCILLPALLMTLFLTSQPLRTLLLHRTGGVAACVAAVLLAVLLHPLGQQLVIWIQYVYPLQEEMLAQSEAFARLLETAPYVWLPFVLLAVLPALCEEMAFRGFILSGLRHVGHKWWAIGLSAVFFGLAHTVIQQSLAAAAIGVVLGYLAVQTGSLVPCILFHMTYNGLMLLAAQLPAWVERWPALRTALRELGPEQFVYGWPVLAACGVLAGGLLVWFHRLPFQATEEEALSDARARQAQHSIVP